LGVEIEQRYRKGAGGIDLGLFFESEDDYVVSNAGKIRRLDLEGRG
jgi:hypothetical protein